MEDREYFQVLWDDKKCQMPVLCKKSATKSADLGVVRRAHFKTWAEAELTNVVATIMAFLLPPTLAAVESKAVD